MQDIFKIVIVTEKNIGFQNVQKPKLAWKYTF